MTPSFRRREENKLKLRILGPLFNVFVHCLFASFPQNEADVVVFNEDDHTVLTISP